MTLSSALQFTNCLLICLLQLIQALHEVVRLGYYYYYYNLKINKMRLRN